MAASAARPASGLNGTDGAASGVLSQRMTSEDEGLDQPRDLRSRDHALGVLARVGIRGAQADELLSGIKFPAPLTEILAHLGKYGIDMDSMTDKMGGSP
jgi:hypothetical protein